MLNGYPFNIWQGGETSPVDPPKAQKNKVSFNDRFRLKLDVQSQSTLHR